MAHAAREARARRRSGSREFAAALRSVAIGLVLAGGIVASRGATAGLQAAPPSSGRSPNAASGGVAYLDTVGDLARPISVASLPNGDLVVVDDGARTVWRISSDGVRRTTPAPPEGWRRPSSVTALADGAILVCDPAAGAIERLGSDGAPQGRVPLPSGVGMRPRAVAVVPGGLALIDEAAPGVCVLGEDGAIRWWCRDADLPGGWGRPLDLAAAPDGRLFVVDADRHRVVILSPEGRVAKVFGDRGPFPGLFAEPSGVAIAGERLLVADRLNHRIGVFDLSGEPKGQWGMHAVVPREGEGRIHYPEDVVVDPGGRTAVVAEPFERRLQRFGDLGAAEGAMTSAQLPARDEVLSHFGAGVSVARDLTALWEPESASVVVFDWRTDLPVHVTTLGGPGTAPDRFVRVSAVAIAPDRDRLAVVDCGSQRLACFDLDRDPEAPLRYDPFMPRLAGTRSLEPVLVEASRRVGSGAVLRRAEVVDAAWTSTGRLLLLDRSNGWLLVLAPRPAREAGVPFPTELVAAWGPLGDEAGRFDDAVALAIAPEGDAVAVLDAGRRTIELLDGDGRPVRTVAVPPPPQGPQACAGLAWTSDGFVVSDALGDRLVRLDQDGAVRGEMGGTGGEDGNLWAPGGLARRPDGTVLVVDVGNHRVQGFSETDGAWRIVFSLGRASTRPRGMPAE